jgi:hypothetical protein
MLRHASVRVYVRRPHRRALPVRGLRDGDAVALQILPQAVVQFREAAELEVGHRLLVLLDLRWVADVARGVS